MKVTILWSDAPTLCQRVNALVEELAAPPVGYSSNTWREESTGCLHIVEATDYDDDFRVIIGPDNIVAVQGETVYGNKLVVATDLDTNTVVLYYDGRRHALYHRGNNSGYLFRRLFSTKDERPPIVADLFALDLSLLQSGHVLTYQSARPDADWWECGLKPPTIPQIPANACSFGDLRRWWRSIPGPLHGLARIKLRERLHDDASMCWNCLWPVYMAHYAAGPYFDRALEVLERVTRQ